MKLSDFDFDLPEDLIATRPARPRSASRLLVAEGQVLSDHIFRDLPSLLRPGDRLVLNDTLVIPARLEGERIRQTPDGMGKAKIEVTLLSPDPDGCRWTAMLKPLRKVWDGETIHFQGGLRADVEGRQDGTATLLFNLTGAEFDQALSAAGRMPLPPYIETKRRADERDNEDYQTIWARERGAVAAPTASLHFDETVMEELAQRGVDISHVTLHVGAGTFLPVKVERVEEHRMHAEWGRITRLAAEEINLTRRKGGRIIPVGTTALRLLESAARPDGTIPEWVGETDIFISPGFEFRATDALITNFHLPKSTLLMLVSALMGLDTMRHVYRHAIAHRYRFFSYGDASLLIPPGKNGT